VNLDKLLSAPPATLALAAILVLALVVVALVAKGRNGRVNVGSLVGRRQGTEETISPAAAKYLDERITHKVNNALAEPVLQLSREQKGLREDVDRIDRVREQTGMDIAIIKAALAHLQTGQDAMSRKLDDWLRKERG